MKLPAVPYSDGIRKAQQSGFAGLNHTLGAGDGEIWDMRNLTSEHYPLLASRPERLLVRSAPDCTALFAWDGLCSVSGTDFAYDGTVYGTVTPGRKQFAGLGAYVIIMPDKAWFNVDTKEFGSLESSWSGTSLTFTNGKLFEETAEANTIQAADVNWADYFKPGDAVTISGCTTHPENNKTPVIREIDGDKLYFYEYIFTLDGDEGTTPYTENGSLSIARKVPDLLYICENENRLWGCDRRTIYASKPGDPFNWNVFDGLSTDSYAVDTGSAGDFTGCVSYLGYPVFFKENQIYKVYGSYPSNFEVMGSATLGVAEGSADSLAIAGETLYYHSRTGIMAYGGGIPQPISRALGTGRFRGAVGGSDGLKYWVSMKDENGLALLYCYDTQLGLWHIEDETEALSFALSAGNLYYTDGTQIWTAGRAATVPDGAVKEDAVQWYAEFADVTGGSADKKGTGKFQLRVELDEGAALQLYVMWDSSGQWEPVEGQLGEGVKRSYYLATIPHRADHFRLKLEGRGGMRLYSLAYEAYEGSALKSTTGRH